MELDLICVLLGPNGLFDLVWCRNSERVAVTAAIVNDITTSRVKLALSTANRSDTRCTV